MQRTCSYNLWHTPNFLFNKNQIIVFNVYKQEYIKDNFKIYNVQYCVYQLNQKQNCDGLSLPLKTTSLLCSLNYFRSDLTFRLPRHNASSDEDCAHNCFYSTSIKRYIVVCGKRSTQLIFYLHFGNIVIPSESYNSVGNVVIVVIESIELRRNILTVNKDMGQIYQMWATYY